MITCVVEYIIDPAQTGAFERFAQRWMELVNRHGGTHHGYFLPAEGALPAPVTTATRVSGPAATSVQIRASSTCICSSAALYLSGRFMVMSSTPWSRRSKVSRWQSS
jgi:hypothetical protein